MKINKILLQKIRVAAASAALMLFGLCITSGQQVLYPVINYTTRDYGRDFHPTNLAVVQDNRGVIYAANGFKLLEFDGSSWNSYPISRETWILSLAVDNEGKIYAGSQGEFGFFSPSKNGELKYSSLSDSLDPADMDFTNIWKVHVTGSGVIFQAEERIFIYRNGRIKVVPPGKATFHTSFTVGERFFARERGTGLLELRNDVLFPLQGGHIFDTTGVFLMVPSGRNDGSILIGTREKGFWLTGSGSGNEYLTRFHPADEKLLMNAGITGGAGAGNGLTAISTMSAGVILIDSEGKTRSIINTGKGLTDNDVKHLIADREKNIWAALNNGISRIEISSPISIYGESSGIPGSINSIIRFNSLLYAGTNQGLIVQDHEPGIELPFRIAEGIPAPVYSLADAGGILAAATGSGLYVINGRHISKIDEEESFVLYYHPGLKLLFSGGPKGLRAWKNEGFLRNIPSLRIDGEDIIGIASESHPSGEMPEFWLGKRYHGAIRIRIGSDLTITTDHFGIGDGLPEGPVIPFPVSSSTVFATIRGLFTFTGERTVKESLPDSLKNNKDFAKGFFSPAGGFLSMAGEAVSVVAEDQSRIWVCAGNKIGYLDKNDSLKYINRQFRSVDAGRISAVYPEANGLCWIGTTDGLIRYDENTGKDYDIEYLSLVRRVSLIGTDSAVYLGTRSKTIPSPSFAYKYNSVRFDFSAPFYEYSDKTEYSYRLSGPDNEWSQWKKETFQEFISLREGNYTFTVKARNIYGKESLADSYSFSVMPPWYRSPAAYISYAIVLILMIWLIVRIYSARLKRENIRLEGIVSDRTAEVVRQKNEIEQKNIVLENQKTEIEDSIRYAGRIQSAVLPSEKACRELFPESFVIFRPLNIVSGDFYWIGRTGDKIICSAADCTGHGVPGAFMSMLGVAFLNEIVNKDKISVPDQILNQLRRKVIAALQQQGVSGETRDGMDMAVISFDTGTGILEYAGAYNPLVMIREGALTEIPGDRMPIGYYDNMHDFTRHEIQTRNGDLFYMYSDGFEDQFGGPDGKKFKSKKLKNLLLEISSLPMASQREILEKTHDEWKGDLPQIDDIVVVGIGVRR